MLTHQNWAELSVEVWTQPWLLPFTYPGVAAVRLEGKPFRFQRRMPYRRPQEPAAVEQDTITFKAPVYPLPICPSPHRRPKAWLLQRTWQHLANFPSFILPSAVTGRIFKKWGQRGRKLEMRFITKGPISPISINESQENKTSSI